MNIVYWIAFFYQSYKIWNMSKETKLKTKIKTGAGMDRLMSEMKKGFKFYDNRCRIEKLEIEMTELWEVLSLNK